jgi:hypothetical protein
MTDKNDTRVAPANRPNRLVNVTIEMDPRRNLVRHPREGERLYFVTFA